jgi:exosome complex RNA-binding protein Rrp4
VIGRIIEVQANRWLVDINSTQFSVLLLSNVNLPGGELRRKKFEDQLLMTDYMKVGDLVSVSVIFETFSHKFFKFRPKFSAPTCKVFLDCTLDL